MIEKNENEKMSGLTRKVCNGLEEHFTGKYRESEMTRLGRKIVQRIPIYSYRGDEMTIAEFAKKYGTNYYNIINRMKAGGSLAYGLNVRLVKYDGEEIDLNGLSRKLSTSVAHLRYNLSRGYDVGRPHKTISLLDGDGKTREYRLSDIADEFCKRNGEERNHGVLAMIGQRLRTGRYRTIDELTAPKRKSYR